MLRASILVALALLSAGCDLDAPSDAMRDARLDRLILPEAMLPPSAAPLPTAFTRVYRNDALGMAMFFTGTRGAMRVHFVGPDGLLPLDAILSDAERTRLDMGSASARADARANAALRATGLGNGPHRIAQAPGGALVEATYGKLHLLSYAAVEEETLRLGYAIDAALLARLMREAGNARGYAVVPRPAEIAPPETAGAALLFEQVPTGLGALVAREAASLYREVRETASVWRATSLAAPADVHDDVAIEAIRRDLAASAR